MNVFDILILAFLAIGAAVGLYRGFFKEFVGTIGLLVAAIGANIASPYAKPWAGGVITDQTVAAIIVWVVIFLLLLLVMNVLAWLLGKVFSSLSIGWINRLAGGALGIIKYALIAALIIASLEFAAAHMESLSFASAMKESHIIPVLHEIADIVMPVISAVLKS